MSSAFRIAPLVQRARNRGRPVVALESSVLAQGLPIPANRQAACRMTDAVFDTGAFPAITAVVRGLPTIGLLDEELERFLGRDGVEKVSARDVAACVVRKGDGATTVAAALALCALAEVGVFATGGIGGVHREPALDESADLLELSRTSVVVVCSGAKSILDLPATMERLETLGVAVVGFATDEFPGFFTATTGLELPARADDPETVARLFRTQRSLGRPGALLVVQPPPADAALGSVVVAEAVGSALDEARTKNVRGAALTPFLLEAVERATHGQSLRANLALLESNARLAGRIAMALAGR